MCSVLFSFLFLNFFCLFHVYLLNLPNKQTIRTYSFCELPILFGGVLRYRDNFIFSWGFWRKLSCQLNRISISHCCVFFYRLSSPLKWWPSINMNVSCHCVDVDVHRRVAYQTRQNWRAQPQFVHKAVKDYPVYWAFLLPFSFFTPVYACIWVYHNLFYFPLFTLLKQKQVN